MERKINKTAWILVLAWAIIAAACAFVFAISYNNKLLLGLSDPGNLAASIFYDIAYFSTVCFFCIALIMAFGFAIYQLVLLFVDNKKAAMRTVFVILALGLMFLVSYLLSSPNDLPSEFFEKNGTTIGSSKMIGAGIICIYILAAGAVISILYTEAAKKLK